MSKNEQREIYLTKLIECSNMEEEVKVKNVKLLKENKKTSFSSELFNNKIWIIKRIIF